MSLLDDRMMAAARRAKAATDAALRGKSADTKDWIHRHTLAAMAYDECMKLRPSDPKAEIARAIADKHRTVARLIGEWTDSKPPKSFPLQQQILVTQHAIVRDLEELKKEPSPVTSAGASAPALILPKN